MYIVYYTIVYDIHKYKKPSYITFTLSTETFISSGRRENKKITQNFIVYTYAFIL